MNICNILCKDFVVQHLTQEEIPASTLAFLACCSKECHEAYRQPLEDRSHAYVTPRWIAYVLWQPDLQPHPGVSMSSKRRLQKNLVDDQKTTH